MSRQGSNRLASCLAMAAAAGLGGARAGAQEGAPVPAPPPAAVSNPAPTADAPGAAVVGAPEMAAGAAVPPAGPVLPAEVQVVRFQGPPGVRVEILGPNPEPVPVGDGHGLLTVGMKVGTPYRLKLSNLPDRPGAELFPVIEIVGHLHRPPGIDPGKYPIRVVFTPLDFEDVADRGRLVTQVIYLEDPEQALPISLPKDEIPVVTLTPSEQPLKVAAALGRVVAVVRLGARQPTADDPGFGAYGVVGPGVGSPCPFTQHDATRCPVPCGPVCGTPPPPGKAWLPKDEYLCDGGDHAEPAHFGGDGGLRGIDPRDAVVQFDDGRRSRALPTNVVCVYAPRFAEVRTSAGPNETVVTNAAASARLVEREVTEAARQGPRRLVQNQGAEAARVRQRPSDLGSRTRAGVHSEVQNAEAFDVPVGIARAVNAQTPELQKLRQKAAGMKERVRFQGIKTAESAVVTGITEGAGQTVMSWTPRETVGVEQPPERPGMAVLKRVSAGEAEAGDTLSYVIQYRNMGNTPIREVAIVDSLLPRLGYVKGSARGPRGTVFSAEENAVGSTELRWVLPAPVPPGASGLVSFQAVVR